MSSCSEPPTKRTKIDDDNNKPASEAANIPVTVNNGRNACMYPGLSQNIPKASPKRSPCGMDRNQNNPSQPNNNEVPETFVKVNVGKAQQRATPHDQTPQQSSKENADGWTCSGLIPPAHLLPHQSPLPNTPLKNGTIFIKTRRIMIGSMEINFNASISFSKFGITFMQIQKSIRRQVHIQGKEMTAVFGYFGPADPAMFIHVTSSCATRLQAMFGMKKGEEPYFHPDAPKTSHRSIVLFLSTMPDCFHKKMLQMFHDIQKNNPDFKGDRLLSELDVYLYRRILMAIKHSKSEDGNDEGSKKASTPNNAQNEPNQPTGDPSQPKAPNQRPSQPSMKSTTPPRQNSKPMTAEPPPKVDPNLRAESPPRFSSSEWNTASDSDSSSEDENDTKEDEEKTVNIPFGHEFEILYANGKKGIGKWDGKLIKIQRNPNPTPRKPRMYFKPSFSPFKKAKSEEKSQNDWSTPTRPRSPAGYSQQGVGERFATPSYPRVDLVRDSPPTRPPSPRPPTDNPGDLSSSEWRQKGNTAYKAALSSTSVMTDRQAHLDLALSAYMRAFATAAENDADLVSAAKNTAMANWKMTATARELDLPESIQHLYYVQAVKYFSVGVARCGDTKPATWLDSLLASYHTCVKDAFASGRGGQNVKLRTADLEELLYKMEEEHYRADVLIEIGQVLFRAAVTAHQDGDYKTALSLLRDCYRPIEEAKMCTRGRQSIEDDIQGLEGDVYLHQCTAESMQARHYGDFSLEELLLEEEDLDMDMTYEVIDWFKKAIILTREVEVEMEAIALSRLGHVYDKVLKDQTRAKTNFLRCLQLAHSMHPRTFHSQTWYQVAQEAVSRYQKKKVDQEDMAWQKERQQYLKELEKELKLLKQKADAFSSDDTKFLQFVYKEFPPKKKSYRLANLDKLKQDDLKKSLQKAVTHYHPDRANVSENGKKYKVLVEEICKELTRRYECRKC